MTILSPTLKLIHGKVGIAPGARAEISSRAPSVPFGGIGVFPPLVAVFAARGDSGLLIRE